MKKSHLNQKTDKSQYLFLVAIGVVLLLGLTVLFLLTEVLNFNFPSLISIDLQEALFISSGSEQSLVRSKSRDRKCSFTSLGTCPILGIIHTYAIFVDAIPSGSVWKSNPSFLIAFRRRFSKKSLFHKYRSRASLFKVSERFQ